MSSIKLSRVIVQHNSGKTIQLTEDNLMTTIYSGVVIKSLMEAKLRNIFTKMAVVEEAHFDLCRVELELALEALQ